MEIFMVPLPIAIVVLFLLFMRNTAVYRFRDKLIDRIYDYNQNTINQRGFADSNLWDVFRMVSYYEMVFKFWKPLKSFYVGTKLEKLVSEK